MGSFTRRRLGSLWKPPLILKERESKPLRKHCFADGAFPGWVDHFQLESKLRGTWLSKPPSIFQVYHIFKTFSLGNLVFKQNHFGGQLVIFTKKSGLNL